MSVIYKTLKKLKTESAEESENNGIAEKRKRSYSFKGVSFNPVIAISLVLLILIAAGGVFFATRGPKKTGKHPSQAKVFKIQQSSEYQQDDVSAEGEGKESVNIGYIPAQTESKDSENTAGKDTLAQDTSLQGDMKLPQIAARRTVENQPEKGNNFAQPQPAVFSSPQKGTFSPQRDEEKKHQEKIRRQRIHRTNLERSLKISRLVDRIHKHIKAGNISLTEKYLTELETLKGKDSTYVLKMRAFWALNRQDYTSATGFLKTALDKNEKDVEAGINMAIVEIKTKQFLKAENRLKKLRKIYPENTAISELVETLKLRSR
ncbi:MAG: tetratricopeptide repeat protein [Thermodesulfobacteriota bacterium]|nr:tetratricopeptide repeat protein [Thermodesulfobacteriota bacterium]